MVPYQLPHQEGSWSRLQERDVLDMLGNHAFQLNRALPGGCRVVGIAVKAPNALSLLLALRVLQRATRPDISVGDTTAHQTSKMGPILALLGGKTTEFSHLSADNTLQDLAEVIITGIEIRRMQSKFRIELRVPLSGDEGLSEQISQNGLSCLKLLRPDAFEMAINGTFLTPEETRTVGTFLASSSPGATTEVEIFGPQKCLSASNEVERVARGLRISLNLSLTCVVSDKTLLRDIPSLLWTDLSRTFLQRLDVMGESHKPASQVWSVPNRVALNSTYFSLPMSDYQLPGESALDSLRRCRDLLGLPSSVPPDFLLLEPQSQGESLPRLKGVPHWLSRS